MRPRLPLNMQSLHFIPKYLTPKNVKNITPNKPKKRKYKRGTIHMVFIYLFSFFLSPINQISTIVEKSKKKIIYWRPKVLQILQAQTNQERIKPPPPAPIPRFISRAQELCPHYKKVCYFQRLKMLKKVLETIEKSIFNGLSDC